MSPVAAGSLLSILALQREYLERCEDRKSYNYLVSASHRQSGDVRTDCERAGIKHWCTLAHLYFSVHSCIGCEQQRSVVIVHPFRFAGWCVHVTDASDPGCGTAEAEAIAASAAPRPPSINCLTIILSSAAGSWLYHRSSPLAQHSS